jgi:small neutral amino acid transporter SnatA (MarC family)
MTGAIAVVKARMPAFNLAGGSLLILVGVLMVSGTFNTPVQQSPSPGKRPAAKG